MDKIEEVKKILKQEVGTFDSESHTYLDDETRVGMAKEICQLFEPPKIEIKPFNVKPECKDCICDFECPELKPGESRLLADMEIVIAKQPNMAYISCSDYSVWVDEKDRRIAKAQLAKDLRMIENMPGF